MSQIEVKVASLPTYDRLVSEIYLEGKFIALITEESPNVFRLEADEKLNVSWVDLANGAEKAIKGLESLSKRAPTTPPTG